MQAASREALPPLGGRLERVARAAGWQLGRLDTLTARIPPWAVLGPLVVLGWGVVAYVAHVAVHTGWVYYNSGDASWYYTTAWVLGHAQIPYSAIGYGYSLLLAPFARIAGPSSLDALPYAVVLNVVVLGPIALFCVYGLARMIAGRRFAYVVSIVWVIAPVLAIPYFDPRYHRRYVGETLPSVLGLNMLGDFPSMVALLVSAYFAFRTVASREPTDALAAGLAAGLALAVKPANALFLPALAVGVVLLRSPRLAALAAAGLLPALLCLAVWKDRGVGNLPLFSSSQAAAEQHLALGAGADPAGISVRFSRYVSINWHNLSHNIDGLREYTWSRRLIEWSIVGGGIALFRRSVAGALFVILWLGVFLVVKGSTVADFNGGGFFRYLAPAFPAAFLMAMSVPLLVPIAGRHLARAGDPRGFPATARARKWVVGVLLFLGLAPLVPLLAFSPESAALATGMPAQSLFVPAGQFPVRAVRHGQSIALSWPAQTSRGARVRYVVFRSPQDELACPASPPGALLCSYVMPFDYATKQTYRTVNQPRWLDGSPGAGTWVYRVAAAAGVPPPSGIDNTFLLSEPVTVTVPRSAVPATPAR